MMNTLTNWLSPAVLQSLGWALVHFLWQGTALAALAGATMALFRRASTRYVIGICTLSLMLAAPVATFFLLERPASAGPATFSATVDRIWPVAKRTTARAWHGITSSADSSSTFSGATFSSLPDRNIFPWMIEAWLTGIALLSLRTAIGFFLLENKRRRQSTSVSGRLLTVCLALQRRLGLSRAVRFCECQWLQAPAVIGWFRPVVLLPITTLTGLSPDQLESVIAHELAHIKRFDAFLNVFQICVETVLFYHPAVWWLNQRIRAEREHCCDDMAIALCGNAVEYARALTLMEQWRGAPALLLAANGGPLSRRIVRLLRLEPVLDTRRRIGLTGSVFCLGAALLAGNTMLHIAYPTPTAYASFTASHIVFEPVGATLESRPAAQTAATPAAKPSPAQTAQRVEQATTEETTTTQTTTEQTRTAQTTTVQTTSGQSATGQSYIEAMKSAGLANLDPDELIALKIQGVTPEYVREMHDLGFHPDADGFVGMKVQGVTSEYIKEMRGLGFSPDADQVVALKVQGVTADYVRGLKEVGIQGDADEIVGLKVQGVTPAYVRELRAEGLTVDSDDVIALKVQGVTPAYVQGLHALGLKPNADDIVGMKVQGVTPEYIRDIRATGLNPTSDDIVGMKVQGVTPAYIKALQSAGFKPDIDEVIGAKVQDITPEFIERARKHGFQNLTIDKLIRLKEVGVLDTKGDI